MLYNAKLNWLNLAIKNLYGKQSYLSLQALELHLQITKEIDHIHLCQFNEKYTNILESIEYKAIKKKKKLDNKLRNLINIANTISSTNFDKHITNPFENEQLVYNFSNETFSTKEINILERGLNYNFKEKSNLDEIITDVESNIQFENEAVKSLIRTDIIQTISNNTKIKSNLSKKDKEDLLIIDKLNRKNVFYLKADKSNAIVILDENEYYSRVENILKNESFTILHKSPLNNYISNTIETLKSCKNIITNNLYKKLITPNPTIPRLYCLPKIHKPGQEMRPIVSCINSPTYLLSKWLAKELPKLGNIQTFSIKDRYDFLHKTKTIELTEDEYLISFDVKSLYPSIPIKETIQLIKDWLISIDDNQELVNEYINLINLCMNQSTFIFNNKYYKQTKGTAMGNPLSYFIANIFISNFETTAKSNFPYFPRIWLRYVDDVFAIFNKNENFDTFLTNLNSLNANIKFTYEIEENQILPFLDLLIIRNKLSNKLEYDIYRKPSQVNRFIMNQSFHPPEQKRAVFNSMIYRLINTPLSTVNYKKELNQIKNIAIYNGYQTSLIDNIHHKAMRKKEMKSKTKLISINENSINKWISASYNSLSKIMKSTFKKNAGKRIAFKTKSKLRFKLKNSKDKIKSQEKSGIYQINCDNCEKIYIGQTKRKIEKRFKEHYAHFKYKRPEKSAIAKHCINTGHSFSNTKLIKHINEEKMLNPWESLYIIKNNSIVLNEEMPIQNSPLLKEVISK